MFFLEAEFKNDHLEDAQAALSELRKIKNSNKKELEEKQHKFTKALANSFNATIEFIIAHTKELNAFTYTVDARIMAHKDKGYAFADPDTLLTIVITDSLLYNDKFSDREIMAIILHEVGHNFYAGGNRMYLTCIESSNKTIRDLAKLKQIVSKTKNDKAAQKVVNTTLRAIEDDNPTFLAIMADIISNAASGIKNLFGSSDTDNPEEFSDEFAASYGYRDDSASALFKLEKLDAKLKNNVSIINDLFSKIVGIYIGTLFFPFHFLAYFLFDADSDMIHRTTVLAENIEAELNDFKDMPKDQRKRYEKQLENIKEVIKKEKEFTQERISKEDDYSFMGYRFAQMVVLSNVGKTAFGSKSYKVINGLNNVLKNKT